MNEYYDRIKYADVESYYPVCAGCNGARYVRYDRPVGDVLFGQYTACRRCVIQPVKEPAKEPEVPRWAR